MALHKLKSLLNGLCPQCRVGRVFYGCPYAIRKRRINEVCPHCGFRFEIEPGYFYAALYVTYAIVVLELIITAVLIFFFSHSESPWVYLAGFAFTVLALAPVNFRLGRLILLYYLTPKIKYRKKYNDLS